MLLLLVLSVPASVRRVVDASVSAYPNASIGLLDLHRCAKAKAKDASILSVVSIVSSAATKFKLRDKMRRALLRYDPSLHKRELFRPVIRPHGLHGHVKRDIRRVCVQHLFVISPWKEICRHFKQNKPSTQTCLLSPDNFYKIVKEAEAHQDVLIAPTIISNDTRAKELMHVLAWSSSRVPWADYVISSDVDTHIDWHNMVELFPPPGHKQYSLWYLGMGSEPNTERLFFRSAPDDGWKACAAGMLHGFSRDLVKHIANTPIAAQLHMAFKFPLHVQLRENSQPGV